MNKELVKGSQELVVFLHNDLDAAGCMLNIEYKWPQLKKKYFFTNYANIKEKVQEIKDYIFINKNTHILCADVSFSDASEELKILTSLCKCTLIDHHMYTEGFWVDFPELKIVHDITSCAAELCNEYLQNKGKNPNLDKLTKIIDIYDIWQTQHPAFQVAQDLNLYFWSYDLTLFVQNIIKNDYKLPKGYLEEVQKLKEQEAQAVKDFEKRKLIHRMGEITLAFVDDHFNKILIDEMEKGQNFVIGISSYGIIKVRINQKCPYSEEQLNKIRYELSGKAEFGHLCAFTFKIKNVSFDNLMKEAERIVKTINHIIKG